MSYNLADVEERNRVSGGEFQIAPAEVRKNLIPGDHAKLIFEAPGKGERMWVRVISADGGIYLGKLANDPSDDFGLQFGDGIDFTYKNVADIQRENA